MCDYSLTENPAESDMPTEAEPWQPVDLSEVEDKLSKLSTAPKESVSTTPMETTSTAHVESTSTASVEAKAEVPPSPTAQQEEVDFGSEPEEVALKTPLVSTVVTLPTSTSAPSERDSTIADVNLPPNSTSTPAASSAEVNPQPKGAPEVKSPPATRAAAVPKQQWRIYSSSNRS